LSNGIATEDTTVTNKTPIIEHVHIKINIMKKLLFIVIAALALFSCTNAAKEAETGNDKTLNAADFEKQIEAEIVAANNLLKGKQIDFNTLCDGAEYKDKTVHYYYIINEEFATIDQLKENESAIKERQIAMFENQPEAKQFIDMLKKAKCSMRLHFTGNQSGDTHSFELYNFK
jgi:hypothetical protein